MDDTTQVGRPWRVGVLFSETGVTAAVERTQLQATLLAIDEINAAGGVLDLPLEPCGTTQNPTLSDFAPWPNSCLASTGFG
jgi:ABC-type branched-subunit amino acid transport system substrate-binding protein